MITKLSEKAKEGGSYTIVAAFNEVTVDAEGIVTKTPFTPNAGLNWSLKDKNGNTVNGRTGVAITPAESVMITLFGDDLALAGGSAERAVTIAGTYNGTAGNNLPLVDEVHFQILNLIGKP